MEVYLIIYAVTNTRNVDLFSQDLAKHIKLAKKSSLKSNLDTNQTKGITLTISVQAEKKKIATTTFLDAWDLRSHMAGHFHLWHAVFSYHPGLLGPSS